MATTNYVAPYLQGLEESIVELERANATLRTSSMEHARNNRDLLSQQYAAEDTNMEMRGWIDHALIQRERIIKLERYNLILRWTTLGLIVIATALGWKR